MSNPVNSNVQLATLAAVAVAPVIAPMPNPVCRGVKVVVDVTNLTGTTPSLTVTIRGVDPMSKKVYTILASAALTANGTVVLTVYPGLVAAANLTVNDVLPALWDVLLTIGGTTPAITATIAASMLA